MIPLLAPTELPVAVSTGLLVLRLVVGAALAIHGWPKIHDPLGWMGPGMPAVLQALAAISEFGGGLACALGLLTPAASLGIACTMAVAVARHTLVKSDPFIGGSELAAAYFCVALLLLLAGPGRFSLDRVLFGS